MNTKTHNFLKLNVAYENLESSQLFLQCTNTFWKSRKARYVNMFGLCLIGQCIATQVSGDNTHIKKSYIRSTSLKMLCDRPDRVPDTHADLKGTIPEKIGCRELQCVEAGTK